jgi:hypothetical protein
MSRPKKQKTEPLDMRAHEEIPDDEWMAATARQTQLDRLRVDQFNDDPQLASVLADAILGGASEFSRKVAGEVLLGAVENLTADEAEAFFKRVVQMKRNREQLAHRNGFAFFAYSRYLEETGREPSKPELKAYLMARRETFRDLPAAEDGKGWTRLWQESGLATLAAR